MGDTVARKRIEDVLRQVDGVSLTVASKPAQLGDRYTAHADILIIEIALLRQLLESAAPVYHRLARRIPTVLALSSDDLLDATDLVELVDAWLFTDLTDLAQMMPALILAEAGYTVVPGGFLPAAKIESLRVQAFMSLGVEEQQALLELTSGKSNAQLAIALGVSESRIKALVRNVLRKLHFRNRTQAGIFAARQLHKQTPVPPRGGDGERYH